MDWIIDSVHNHVGFSVKHMMVATVRGQFKSYKATLAIDPKDFARSSFEGEIDVASIDTGNAERDAHLRSADFFDAATHTPRSRVQELEDLEPGSGDGEFLVHGDLTIRGVTKPVALEVEFRRRRRTPTGRRSPD